MRREGISKKESRFSGGQGSGGRQQKRVPSPNIYVYAFESPEQESIIKLFFFTELNR